MSLYSENYTKMTIGYNKINATISSVETNEQLECIPRLIESWVNLVDKYCDEVFNDKISSTHKKDASRLGETCSVMFEELKAQYQLKREELTPEEYKEVFKPKRVKSIVEMVNEQ